MTSFGDKRRCQATTASKPCFALYAIHLLVRGVFSTRVTYPRSLKEEYWEKWRCWKKCVL